MGKESYLQGRYDFFQKLPDELVIFILTKLSSSSDVNHDSIDEIKALGQCSSVSKRFNSLTCLVPTLSIKHLSIKMLCKYCPNILKKFKHIRSLQVTHWSSTEARMTHENKSVPIIYWEASYRPHSYCLALVSYKKLSYYFEKDPQSLMLPDDTSRDDEYHESVWSHIKDMICLHHMLVSSIKDHKYLQRVVVTDLNNLGTLTLEEDMLAKLRNCTSTNLEQVLVRDRSGSAINLDVPFVKNHLGIVIHDVCFSVIEWWEKATDACIHKDEDVAGIPSDLPCGDFLMKFLKVLLEDPAKVEVNDGKAIHELLSFIKSNGKLL